MNELLGFSLLTNIRLEFICNLLTYLAVYPIEQPIQTCSKAFIKIKFD